MAAKKKAAPAKKKVAAKKETAGRAVGKTTGVGVEATWCVVFAQNEKCKKADRKTDAELTEQLKSEFPGRVTTVFDNIQPVRNKYNKGGLTKGEIPKTQSKRYDENGDVIVGRVSSKKPEAKKAPAEKKVAAKKKVARKKK